MHICYVTYGNNVKCIYSSASGHLLIVLSSTDIAMSFAH